MNCTSPVLGQYRCGKCVPCRAYDRQQWVFRLRMELDDSDFGLFTTLTYNDDNIPAAGVSKRDCQLFLKRLRKHYSSNTLRYYIVSEYGDHTLRPHYHGLLFFKNASLNSAVYDNIETSWQNGFVGFGECNEATIVYCTKYCLKGSNVPLGSEKNFRLLSKMSGGIGYSYIEKQHDYHVSRLAQPTMAYFRTDSAPLPRYYRQKYLDTLSEDEREDIKQQYLQYLTQMRYDSYDKDFKKYLHKLHISSSQAGYDEFVRYDDYLKLKQSIREEITLKHTKKQSIW